MLINSNDLKKLKLQAFDSNTSNDTIYEEDFRQVKNCLNSTNEIYFIVDKLQNKILVFKYFKDHNFSQEFIEDLYDNYLKPYIIEFKNHLEIVMNFPEDIAFYLKLNGII